MIVYGQNPVRELVRARPKDVAVVYVSDAAAKKELYALCRDRGVAFEERPRGELDALAGPKHQGAVAIAGEHAYRDLDEVLDAAAGPALVVVLDGVQDPRNLGAIIRSAHVLGAHAVVVGKDRAAPVTPVTVKASAGATEHLPICRVTNVVRAIEGLKERELWIVGAVTERGQPPSALDLKLPTALVLGGEGAGLRALVERTCDHRALIPMTGRVASLNVSVAAGILLYEAQRQRML